MPITTTEKPKWKKIELGIGKVHKSKTETKKETINEINPSVVHAYNQLDMRRIVFFCFYYLFTSKIKPKSR